MPLAGSFLETLRASMAERGHVLTSVSVHCVVLIVPRCFGSRFTGMSIVDRLLLRAWIVVPANVDVTYLLSHPGELCRLT
ncbi:unnamed protein product, partial [Ectocarpus sp. 12 AP-2014]